MSRHGYVDDCYDQDAQWAAIRWQGALRSSMRGKRGQKYFRDLVAALDAMTVKELHAHNVSGDCVCAMGALAKHRGVDLSGPQEELDNEYGDHEGATEIVGDALDIAPALARETTYWNDEGGLYKETPAQRWSRMRQWAASHIREAKTNG